MDFRQAPTFQSELNLEIFGRRYNCFLETTISMYFCYVFVVPPEKPLLIDEEGNQVKRVFGPFFEGEISISFLKRMKKTNNLSFSGEQVTLSCEVTGGDWKKT